ncbi:hypothetical protein ACS0TY_020336 [Phlomoides rotata]
MFPLFSLLIITTSMFPIYSSGQCDCPIQLGWSLDAGRNSGWLSPSGDFAFGFQLLPLSPFHDQDRYLLAIWYNKIPEATIVWSKNSYPVPEGSRIQLTEQGQLILSDSRGKEIWRAGIGNRTSTGAAMLDSGNFVLRNGDDSIWESFSYPTDTMLPGQKLITEGNLTARQSEADYTDGRFFLKIQGDGNLVLYTKDQQGAYWASNTLRSNATRLDDSQLIFDKAGNYIYIQQGNERNDTITNRVLGSKQGFYYIFRLDFDGVLKLYTRPRITSGSALLWDSVQNIPEDICRAVIGDLGSGACGFNSYCENKDGRTRCFCPEGYSFIDEDNTRKGCKPDFPMPICQQHDYSNTYIVELNSTNWPMADYDLQTVANKDVCKESCLTDCFCAAAIYNRANQCWKKRFPLSNGRKGDDLNSTLALMKVVRVPRDNSTGDSSSKVILLAAFLGSSVFLNLLLSIAVAVGVFFFCYRKKQLASTVHGVKVYSYKQLEEATGGFKQQLGRGSFGTVYKGVIPSIPRRYVAIKRLDKDEREGEKEFTTEVSAIGRTHHKNLVTLLGYCDEGQHRLLVYEYMSNGSLDAHLFRGLSRPRWNQRMQIAFGIARGLTYLHEECGTQIIHCDVKPQNILLDEFLAPKISDFGMAKLLLSEQSRAARTHIRGTIGYFAPEWFRKASITVKVDVYSFGMMLLEIVCCMSSVEFGMGDQEEALIDWVYDCYIKRMLNKLVENDEEGRNDMKSVERVVMVGIWCVQEDPSLRPSMRRVAQMLEGVAQVSVPPRPDGFSSSLI